MKRILALTLTFILLTGALLMTGCQEKSDAFIVGFDEGFPPFGFRDENNNIVGFDIDLATEAASRMGVEVKFQPIDWKSKDKELDSGNISCIWNGFTMHVDTRDDDYTWTEPSMKNNQIIVVLADSGYTTLADLAGKKIALQSGSSAEAALNGNEAFKASLGEIVYFDDNMKALMDLDIKQTDAVLMDEPVAKYNMGQKADQYRIMDEILSEEEFGVGFKKGNTDLRDKVQKALEDMAADGKLTELSNKWFGKDVTIIGK